MTGFGNTEVLCPCGVVLGEWWDGSLIGVGSKEKRGLGTVWIRSHF